MSEVTVPASDEKGSGTLSSALTLLNGIHAFTRFTDRFYTLSAYICGALLLLLALFITYQVVARKVGFIMAEGTDQNSGYVMVFAITWGFCYALRTGGHVRIDVLLPLMSKRVRWLADWTALGSIAALACITAWRVWADVIISYDLPAFSLSYPRTPLWIPQTVLGIGISLLAFATLQMMINMIAEAVLPWLHRLLTGAEAPQALPEEPTETGSPTVV